MCVLGGGGWHASNVALPCRSPPPAPAPNAGESRGFAFINFIHREDANRAIAKLDGFGYDNLILSVSMAAPRPERP